MNETEIIKDLETKVDTDKLINDYAEREKVKHNKIVSLISNTNYFEWLNQFTQDKEVFYSDDWLYTPELIKDSDKENVDKLCFFYKGIDDYATQKNIYPLQCEFGNFYKIRLDAIGFEIGVLIGQGTVFFCEKVAVENEQEFIDFNDIMKNQIQSKKKQLTKN